MSTHGRRELQYKVATLIHQRSGHVENHERWGGCHDAANEVLDMLPPDLVAARAALEELQMGLDVKLAEARKAGLDDGLRVALERAAPPPAPADVLAPTDENVERVARVLFEDTFPGADWDAYPDTVKNTSWLPRARHILAALRTARDLPPNSDSKGKG